MIWRFLGWLTVLYLAAGGLAVGLLVAAVGFTHPGGGIDWSFVPGRAVVPLWVATSSAGFAGFVLATIPAPIGFFRRSRGLGARTPLLIYVAATLLVAFVTLGAPAYLMRIGPVRTSANSWVLFEVGDVTGAAWVSAMAAVPVVGAVAALRQPAHHPLQRGFEVQEAPGRGPGH